MCCLDWSVCHKLVKTIDTETVGRWGFWHIVDAVYDDGIHFSISVLYLTFYCALTSNIDHYSVFLH